MIDPTTQLAAMIRAQFAAQFRAQAAKERPLSGRHAGQAADARQERRANESASDDAQLQQLVALRVRALSPDDPQRGRKAFRLFLESVLVQAFGRDRLDDRGFDQMVDAVLQRMEGDPALHEMVHEAGELLLADAGHGGPPSAPGKS